VAPAQQWLKAGAATQPPALSHLHADPLLPAQLRSLAHGTTPEDMDCPLDVQATNDWQKKGVCVCVHAYVCVPPECGYVSMLATLLWQEKGRCG